MVNKPVSARHHLASLALAVLATFSTSIHAQATISAGDTTYRGSFTTDAKTGAVNGSGTVQWKNGNRYEGPVVNTQLTGKGSFTWANGDTYVGDLVNAQPHGQGTYTFKSGDRYVGAWRNGQKHGQGRYTFANGSVWEGEFANDQQFKEAMPAPVLPTVPVLPVAEAPLKSAPSPSSGAQSISIPVTAVSEAVVADSFTDFSGTQGKKGWHYGYANGSIDAYSPTKFTEMRRYEEGNWFPGQAANPPWTQLWDHGGHPNGANSAGGVQTVVRRWVSTFDGTAHIYGNFFRYHGKEMFGIYGAIQVDGSPVWLSWKHPKKSTEFSVYVPVSKGSKIDFLLDPAGEDGSDSTRYVAVIAKASATPANASATTVPATTFFDAARESFEKSAKEVRERPERLAKEERERQAELAAEKRRKQEQARFDAAMGAKDPQAMYLAAGKYEREGDSYSARKVYEQIIDRFPSSPFAAKANDQLLANQRSDKARSDLFQAQQDAQRQQGERAYQACKEEVDACYSRTKNNGNCWRNCNSLR